MSALFHLARFHRLQSQAYAARADYYAARGVSPDDAKESAHCREVSADYSRMADEDEAEAREEML